SALGQGNTMAGADILGKMFGTGPMGMPAMKPRGAPRLGRMPQPRSPKMMRNRFGKFADGGEIGEPPQEQEHIPIVAAGGEFIVPPEVVAEIGNGNIDHGHRVLDRFTLLVRNEYARTLKKLPRPKK
ncbi:MAG TPA: hypothetical protein VI077_08080, partial [Pseudolabrys sp.]